MRWTMVMVALTGCFVEHGSGVPAEEVRDVGAFHEVANTTSVAVEVVEGDAAGVLVRCDANLVDLVRTEVRDDELRVSTPSNTSIRPETDCVVEVTAPALRGLSGTGSGPTTATGAFPDLLAVKGTGSGTVTADGLVTQVVAIESTGSGGVVATGTGGFAELDSSGSGGIDAVDLTVDEADVRSSGSGDVSITVVDHATVELSGSGDVRIDGQPRVDADDRGSGEVVVDR